MNYDNYAQRLKREVLIRSLKALGRDESLDRIPLTMIPREKGSFRCCVYRDRAVIRYRIMAALGFPVEEETDELRPLDGYAEEALVRPLSLPGPTRPVLTVLQEACTSCSSGGHFVTNACRSCVARPCQVNCPKDAIRFSSGAAQIDAEKCVQCGKCLQVCPYGAIIKMAAPCEKVCPVGALTKDDQGRVILDAEKCTACGKCMKACPFGAVMEVSQVVETAAALASARKNPEEPPLVALVAPAAAGQFPGSPEQLRAALGMLGFSAVAEAAGGAEITAVREAREWRERCGEGREAFMTTSCCPAYVGAAQGCAPSLALGISHTPSPMIEAAERITLILDEMKLSDGKIIFIGPCTAKRKEAQGEAARRTRLSGVLTFEELAALFVAAGVDVREMEDSCPGDLSELDREILAHLRPGSTGRGFPVSGGVARAFCDVSGDLGMDPPEVTAVDGFNSRELKRLDAAAKAGRLKGLVEVMACEGGCVAGPGTVCASRMGARKAAEWAALAASR